VRGLGSHSERFVRESMSENLHDQLCSPSLVFRQLRTPRRAAAVAWARVWTLLRLLLGPGMLNERSPDQEMRTHGGLVRTNVAVHR